jgi:ubiquitin-activating enzyme E1
MDSEQIDESLYNRQLYVIGVDAMKKLTSSTVIISCLGGLGVEIAKNIILAGVKNVILHDLRNTTIDDLAAQFYLTENDIGKNRAEASVNKLASLNNYVSVSVNTTELTEEFIKTANCLVLTDYQSYSEVTRISNICHSNDIKFIFSDVRGIFGIAFIDFGNNFQVLDQKGEQPSRFLLSCISPDGLVTINEEDLHCLSDNDLVRFEEVEGLIDFNGRKFPVEVIDAHQFKIGDVSSYGTYTSIHSCGYGNQVFAPLTLNFKSFEEAIKQPEFVMFDFGAEDRDQQVILAFLALMKYIDLHPGLPSDVSFDDIFQFAQEINSIYSIVEEIDENILKPFSQQTNAVISPLAAAYGGIVGQEILKAVSNKFTPIFQNFTSKCSSSK